MKGIGIIRSKRETLPIIAKQSANIGPGQYNIDQATSWNGKSSDRSRQYF